MSSTFRSEGENVVSDSTQASWEDALATLQNRFYLLTDALEKLEDQTQPAAPEKTGTINRLNKLQESVVATITSLRSDLISRSAAQASGCINDSVFSIESHTEILQTLIKEVDFELSNLHILLP